jgi:hypothetical protein
MLLFSPDCVWRSTDDLVTTSDDSWGSLKLRELAVECICPGTDAALSFLWPKAFFHHSLGHRPVVDTCLFAPEGPSDNSPVIYHWVNVTSQHESPVGTIGIVATKTVSLKFSRPYGTFLDVIHPYPSDKSLGYYQVSLRDRQNSA